MYIYIYLYIYILYVYSHVYKYIQTDMHIEELKIVSIIPVSPPGWFLQNNFLKMIVIRLILQFSK